MGGALFASLGAKRHTTAELELAKPKIELFLSSLGLKFAYPKEFSIKPDHGDLDIIVSYRNLKEKLSVDKSIAKLDNVVINGQITSILFDSLQVDLIFVQSDHFEFATKYYSWGDLGNVIGIYARTVGLKLGEHGLYKETNTPQYGISRSYLTFDFYDLLAGIGLPSQRFDEGFADFYEVIDFFKHSPIIPVLSDLNSSARRRLRKRPNQVLFQQAVENGDFGQTDGTQSYGCEVARFTPAEVQVFTTHINGMDTHSHACVYGSNALSSKSQSNQHPNISVGKNVDRSYFLTYGRTYRRLTALTEISSVVDEVNHYEREIEKIIRNIEQQGNK